MDISDLVKCNLPCALFYTLRYVKQKGKKEPLGESQLNLTNTLLQGAFRPQTPCLNFAPPNKNPKSAPDLLAGETAISLGILNLNKQETINTCQQQTNVHGGVSSRLVPLINKFQNTIFSGRIGKLKNYQVKLRIDKNIPPVAQKERRIPFALRKKVENEIKRLEEEDIIEDVTAQPTPWLNPLVMVPKGEDQIRLCVDMRAANKAITRTRYPTRTVDDLMIKLKGAKVFTKLDLTSAFLPARTYTRFANDHRISNRYKNKTIQNV